MVFDLKIIEGRYNSLRPFPMLLLFFLALQPFALNIGGQGVTANYLYVLFPILFWIVGIKRKFIIRKNIILFLIVYCMIYILSIPEDIIGNESNLADPIRRFASFMVFILPLFLVFIKFKLKDINLFKKAIVLTSIYYSLSTFFLYISIPNNISIFELKTAIGSQRYGFILCMGFYITLFGEEHIIKKWPFIQKLIICVIILIGIIFTFSRSSVVSLVGGLLIYMFWNVIRVVTYKNNRVLLKNVKFNSRFLQLLMVFMLIGVFYSLFQYLYQTNFLNFYIARFVDPLLNSTLLDNISNVESSEGYRVNVARQIGSYLMSHPFFGSHYQGLYLILDEYEGGASSHNQYTDIFLRTGLVGGFLWLYLLSRIIRFCSANKGLLVALVSVLIYGLFHETFKLSQGSFIFGMLLSFTYIKLTKNTVLASNGAKDFYKHGIVKA